MKSFSFNGIDSSAYNVYVQNKNVYNSAERDITMQSIPGRDGDLIIDNERRNNIDIQYDCVVIATEATLPELLSEIRMWLTLPRGYKALSDSYMSDRFRLGICKNQINITEDGGGTATLSVIFNCKPLAYLNGGQNIITITSSPTTVTNNSGIATKPYIKITGSGNIILRIGAQTLDIRGINAYIEIDSDIESAYKGSTLLNSSIYSYPFPLLNPGNNAVSWSGTGSVTKIEIIPRWYAV